MESSRYFPNPIVLTSGGLENQLLVAYLSGQNHSVNQNGVFVMGVEGRHITVIPNGKDFTFKRSDEIDREDPLWEIVNEQSVGNALVLNRKPGEYIMSALDFNKDKRRGYDPSNPKSFILKIGQDSPKGMNKLLFFASDYDVNRKELFDEITAYHAKLTSATEEQLRALAGIR